MAHVHQRIDFTASAYVVFKKKVLLRMHDKYGVYLPPGGHVELDEDPVQAAVREVKEETGLDVTLWDGNKKFSIDTYEAGLELIPPVSLNRHHTSPEHEHINLAYFATTKDDTLNPAEGETTDGLVWCAKEDLETMDLRPDIKFYSALAIDTLGEK
jgi:8-oxo-dGTP pyrophosphatase MutT (NUDIX family)